MATRLHLPFGDTTNLTFTGDASWESTAGVTRAWMDEARINSTMTSLAVAEVSTSGTFDVLIAQFVSKKRLAAQTITGNFKGIIRALESAADADMRMQCVVRVIADDGTVRGTLIASNAGALSSEFDATTLTNRNIPLGGSTAVSSVVAVIGDRLVVELGYRAHNTTATSKTGTLRVGDASATDLAENETGTTDNSPWVEFSNTITWDTDENLGDFYSGQGGVEQQSVNTSMSVVASSGSGAALVPQSGVNVPIAAWPPIGRGEGAGSGSTCPLEFFLMVGIDPDCPGYPTTPTYRSWVVTGTPDYAGAMYPTLYPRCGTNPFVNIELAAQWFE